MNRGDALQFGFELDTDGRQWNVTVHGSTRPDFTFGDIEAFIEWLRDENDGLLISRMARIQKPKLTEPCGCPVLPFPPRPGCPHHDELGCYTGGRPDA